MVNKGSETSINQPSLSDGEDENISTNNGKSIKGYTKKQSASSSGHSPTHSGWR